MKSLFVIFLKTVNVKKLQSDYLFVIPIPFTAASSTADGSSGGGGGVKSMSLKCPTCRRKVTLDARGLASLPRNFLLENIVARYKEESAKAGKKARTKPVMCQVKGGSVHGEK